MLHFPRSYLGLESSRLLAPRQGARRDTDQVGDTAGLDVQHSSELLEGVIGQPFLDPGVKRAGFIGPEAQERDVQVFPRKPLLT
jgi:hypothetical protein